MSQGDQQPQQPQSGGWMPTGEIGSWLRAIIQLGALGVVALWVSTDQKNSADEARDDRAARAQEIRDSRQTFTDALKEQRREYREDISEARKRYEIVSEKNAKMLALIEEIARIVKAPKGPS